MEVFKEYQINLIKSQNYIEQIVNHQSFIKQMDKVFASL